MKIFVTSAFNVRFPFREEMRMFAPGVHELSEEEFGHWFVQGCIQEGRVTILSDGVDEAMRLKGKLCSMADSDLRKMAMEMGIDVQGNLKKDSLIAMILKSGRA